MPRVDIDTEFVVAAAEVLDEGVSGADHSGRAELGEAAHRSQSGLEPALVGFDGVIGVLLSDVAYGGQQFVEHAGVGRCPVGGDVARAVPCSSARVKNRRVAVRSLFSETSTSMTCPYWSIAR